MHEDETIADFNTRVLDIANEAFALGEPISEEKLVRKVLRSLTKRFGMKALAVKEANDVKTMRLYELMGSLQTQESDLNEEDLLTKDKSIGLKAEVSVVPDKMGDLSEQQLALFAKNFGRFIRKQYDKGADSGQSSYSRFQKDGKFKRGDMQTTLEIGEPSTQVVSEDHIARRKSAQFTTKKMDERRCFHCNQVGHLKSRCPDLHRMMSQSQGMSKTSKKQVWKAKQKGEACHVAISSTSHLEKL
ncbi:unnamed protein product [Rhodiola kirilowii]